MPRKKITIGHSSKNGQKAVFDRLFYGEITREDQAKILSVKQEADIEFDPPRDRDFEKTAYTVAAILGGNSSELDLIHRQERKEFAANVEKLYLLMDHYGINHADPVNFTLLAIELARELFPTSPTRGRGTKWTSEIVAMLVVEMERKINSGKNESDAARALSRDKYWSSFLETKSSPDTKENKPETLRNKYSKSKNKKDIKLLRQALDSLDQSQLESRKRSLMRKYINI